MPVNFNSHDMRGSYAERDADVGWSTAIDEWVKPEGKTVIDIGCGGGIYTRALRELGAARVIGIDASGVMVEDAQRATAGLDGVSVQLGRSDDMGLPVACTDVVFGRALIHHLPTLGPTLRESLRVLRKGGLIVLQDRTPDDVVQPPSRKHFRGYLFEAFPRLLDLEIARRRPQSLVVEELERAGFQGIKGLQLWETRRVYREFAELALELQSRTARSILHELTDTELQDFIDFLRGKFEDGREIVEEDRWTLWFAEKPY